MDSEGALSVIDSPPTDRPEWSVGLVIDFALGVSDEDILEAHGLQYHKLQRLKEDEFFMLQVAKLKRELQKEGVSFKLKAQLQADQILRVAWNIIHDVEAPANTRAKLIEDVVRWAGFDNQGGSKAATGSGSRFTLMIDLSGDKTKGITVDGSYEEDDG